eukprot:s56_g6.t1
MHLPRAIRYHFSNGGRSPDDLQRANRAVRYSCPMGCFDCLAGQKLHVWCPMALLIFVSILCIGMFEAMRLSTHVLSSPCTITRSELSDVGTCTLCDSSTPSTCQIHPITTARLSVNFKHRHLDENITGSVWSLESQALACGTSEAGLAVCGCHMASSLLGWTGFPYCGPAAEPCCELLEAVHFRPLACAEPTSPEAERGESTTCTQVSVQRSHSDLKRSCGRGLGYGPSPVSSSISPVSYRPVGDVPLAVQSEGLLEVDEAVLVKESDVVEQSAPRVFDPRSRSMPVDLGRVQELLWLEHAGDIVVDDAMAIEEPDEPDLDDEESGALAIANSHLRSIEAELRAHRDLISQEGRRKLEQEIEAEKQRIEDERRRKIEEAEMAARREEEKRLEEELEAARRRAEEEARLAAQRSEDR